MEMRDVTFSDPPKGTSSVPVVAIQIVDNPRDVTDAGVFQFSLSSLMLLITLASFLMAVLVLVPPLGVLIGVLSLVALYRTSDEVKSRIQQGRTVRVARKCEWFIHHLMVTAFIGVAAWITFMMIGVTGCIFSALAMAIPGWEWLAGLGMIISWLLACWGAIYVTIQIWKGTGRGWL